MNVEVRIYKRFDTDLLSLHDAGFSVAKIMTEALSAYANGIPCHFFLDEMVPFDLNDKKSIRLRLKLKKNDYNTISLLQNIKHGYRSNFCKQVLRNALIQQNLICYYSDIAMLPVHETNAKTINTLAYPNLKKCSDYRRRTHQQRIMGQDITTQYDRGIKISPIQSTPAPQHNQNTQAMPYTVPNTIPSQPWTPYNTASPVYVAPQPVQPVQTAAPVYEPAPQIMQSVPYEQTIQSVPSVTANPVVNVAPMVETKKEVKQDASPSPTQTNNAVLMSMFDNI